MEKRPVSSLRAEIEAPAVGYLSLIYCFSFDLFTCLPAFLWTVSPIRKGHVGVTSIIKLYKEYSEFLNSFFFFLIKNCILPDLTMGQLEMRT